MSEQKKWPKRIHAYSIQVESMQGEESYALPVSLVKRSHFHDTTTEYLSKEEHEHIVAEKDAEIARLREALKGAADELHTISCALVMNLDDHKVIQWENAHHAGIAYEKLIKEGLL